MKSAKLPRIAKPAKEGKKPDISFSKAKIEKIRKEFNESRYLYEIENEKNPFGLKIKEIEKNLTELEENLSKTKKSIMIMIIVSTEE